MTKQELRDKCKQLRASIPPEGKKKLDELIRTRIAQTKVFRNAGTVLLYVPVRGEIDLLPLVRLCRKQGKQVGFPVVDQEQHTMEFRLLAPDGKLVPGAYGIPEPPKSSVLCKPDAKTLCILPGLSFDRQGNRLGYGAGYYDRFLEHFPGVTLGAVFQKLMAEQIPAEPHDRKADWIVNEREAFACGGDSGGKSAESSAGRPAGRFRRVGADKQAEEMKAKTVKSGNPGNPARFSRPESSVKPPDSARSAEPAKSAKPAKSSKPSAELFGQIKQRAGEVLSEWLEPVRKTLNRWLQAEPNAKKASPAELTSAEGKQVGPRHGPPILVLMTFLFLILSRVIEGKVTRRGSEYVLVILLQILIFVLPAVLYIQLRGEYFPERIRMRPVRPEHLWFCVCVLVVMVCGSLLISILTGGISSLNGNFTLYDTFVARINGSVWETVYVILAYGVLPAFCEELVYRSVLCAEYESAGTGVAVFVSAVFFAMLHFSFPLFLNYLFLGMLLAGVMYATRSTVAAMVLHLLYNLFCLFGQPYLSAFYVNAGSSEIFIFCLIVLLLLFAAFGAGEARKIYHVYAKANASSDYTVSVRFAEYPKRVAKVLFTPTAGVVGVVWLVMAIISMVR